MMRKLALIALAVLLLLAAGCGKKDEEPIVSDGGPVTQDEQPVEDGAEEVGEPDSGESDAQTFAVSENGMTREADKLIWVTNVDFPPYEFLDENGEVVGIDAAVAHYIADRMGLTLVIQDINFDSVVDAVEAGSADVGIAGLTVTDDRKAKVDFSESYGDSVQVIVVKADSQVASVRDLEGKVGVLLGSFGWQYAKGNVHNAEIKRYNTTSDIFMALQMDEIDAVIIDYESAHGFADNNSDAKVLPDELTHEVCAVAVNKENEGLLEQVNAIIMEMKENGKLEEILTKYLSEP